MPDFAITLHTVCGIEELTSHSDRAVTHILSIIDPDEPDPPAFGSYGSHNRTLLRFHDIIRELPGMIAPQREDVEKVLDFGRSLPPLENSEEGHLLVHCHMGISRSTAAMATLIAEAEPRLDEDELFLKLVAIRGKAWPNSRMIAFADDILGRGGRLTSALRRHYTRQLTTFPRYGEQMRQLGRGAEVEMAA